MRRSRSQSLRALVLAMDPRTRIRLAIAAGLVAIIVVLFVACGSGKRGSGAGPTSPTGASGSSEQKNAMNDASTPRRDQMMWARAKEGIPEDLATLAVHEGAMGLVEAAEEPDLRPTALRAMAHARGWAHLPFLAKVATGKDDEDARLALASVVDLAARERLSEDPEDVEELEEGCKTLVALAKDTGQSRTRRIPAIRALRMMPCPSAELPTDLDAR